MNAISSGCISAKPVINFGCFFLMLIERRKTFGFRNFYGRLEGLYEMDCVIKVFRVKILGTVGEGCPEPLPCIGSPQVRLGQVCVPDSNLSREKCKTSWVLAGPERILKLGVILRFSNQTMLVLICIGGSRGQLNIPMIYYIDLGKRKKFHWWVGGKYLVGILFHEYVFTNNNIEDNVPYLQWWRRCNISR